MPKKFKLLIFADYGKNQSVNLFYTWNDAYFVYFITHREYVHMDVHRICLQQCFIVDDDGDVEDRRRKITKQSDRASVRAFSMDSKEILNSIYVYKENMHITKSMATKVWASKRVSEWMRERIRKEKLKLKPSTY